MSSKATFTTVSKAVCNHGIMSLLGVSKLPLMDASDPSTQQDHKIDDLVEKFKIPRNASRSSLYARHVRRRTHSH